MTDVSKQEIKLFYCYAHEDKALREELEVHLSSIKRQHHLTNWSDREILPGEQWEEAIDFHLNSADVILLLISPHFLASEYCCKEMQQALERHRAGTCRVIPILLRPTFWENAPFSGIELLPTDAKPITSWADRYEAFHNVVKGINSTLKSLQHPYEIEEEWSDKGDFCFSHSNFEGALVAYDQAIRQNPDDVYAYFKRGASLHFLRRYDNALDAYNRVTVLNPSSAVAYASIGQTLYELKRYDDALAAFDQAIHLNPNDAFAYSTKGHILHELKCYDEALTAFDQAIHLNPNDTFASFAYMNKAIIFFTLNRHEEAQKALDQANRLNPSYVDESR